MITDTDTGGASPWDDYRFLATLTPNEFGIDGTVLTLNNQNYFVWSCITSDLQGLCIATLDTPGSIGPRHELSIPLESWEVDGFGVNEGPAPLYHDGKTFLAFSASYCGTASYQLGLLTYEGGDPLEKSSWTKTGPLFSSANGNYGTAHNGLVIYPYSHLHHTSFFPHWNVRGSANANNHLQFLQQP